MNCSVLVGPPGCGKTENVHSNILERPRRWLIALPRTDLIEEQALELTRKALAIPLALPVEAIHCDQPNCRGKVGRRVVQAIQALGQLEHAVILATHAALLDLDPKLLRGWNVAIDEVPERGVVSGQFAAGTTWQMLERLYSLRPVGADGRWWLVVARADADLPTPGEVIHDAAEALREFHRCALTPGRIVLVDIADWQEARSTRRKIRWHSCWTPGALLQHADSVTIAGAGVMDSLVCRAAQHAPLGPIPFVPVRVGVPRTGRPKVVIHYYTRHEGSTAWWSTREGDYCLVMISRHLERIGFQGYWSGNEVVRPYLRHRFPGQEVAPKVAGTNELRHHRSCALIYSNKAQAADEPVMEALGLDRADIRRAREDEDVVQFVFRGLLRDGGWNGTYEVHLYSEGQAEMLRSYLVANDITDDVALVPVWEAGLMEAERPRADSPDRHEIETVTRAQREQLRAEKARLRAKRNRELKAAQAAQAGLPRPKRGRPAKQIGTEVPGSCVSAEGSISNDILGL